MTKELFLVVFHIPCKVAIADNDITEAERAQRELNTLEWQGSLRLPVKAERLYVKKSSNPEQKELLEGNTLYILVTKDMIHLAYDGWEGIEFAIEMYDIRDVPDIWADNSFKWAFNSCTKMTFPSMDKRLISKVDRKKLKRVVLLSKLEDSV